MSTVRIGSVMRSVDGCDLIQQVRPDVREESACDNDVARVCFGSNSNSVDARHLKLRRESAAYLR
jgi:hypothetical protein